MRPTTTATQTTWQSGDFVGAARPMVRVTVQRMSVCLSSFGTQTYASMMFGQASKPVELPNVRDVKWSRSTDQIATCTITLFNTDPLPLGQTPETELDTPGAYTYQRGTAFYSSRWGHTATGWQDWLVPDRIVRTYEGYGFNPGAIPEQDSNLYLSGTWLIDEVDLGHDGYITLTCRDLGRALLDQICFPPVVPLPNYPLYFEPARLVQVPPVYTITGSDQWFPPCWDSDSNQDRVGTASVYYPGAERANPAMPGQVAGHTGYDAVDNLESTYWLSYGQDSPDSAHSYEWITFKFKPRTLGALKFRCWGGPYRVYVSVLSIDGVWHGNQRVPYDPEGHRDNGSGGLPYVESFDVDAEAMITHPMQVVIDGAWKVRFTFTHLTGTGDGKYRCGVRYIRTSAQVTSSTPGTSYTVPPTTPPRYDDYTDIVKILLAWSGFYWPRNATTAVNTRSDGAVISTPAPSDDPVLASGRVWGDFQQTGTHGVAPLGVSFFDKKPIADCINGIRDMVGFLFFIDEGGGAVFRPPNIWSIGNWVGNGSTFSGRTTDTVTIDEQTTLMSLGAKLSSRSIRERVFVGSITGQVGATSSGHNPYPSGLRRIGGWTDQHFDTAAECQIMADLITLRQLFTYRTDKVQIPGNPAIQVDDQVRIYERVTEEGYLHYVTDITMNWSIETGKYTYDMGTHWLGETPFSNWTFDPSTLAAETQSYLKALGVYS